WIATTNLDSRVRYIWNMTRIAATRHPRALDLFHSLMIASAAIPGAFPPVMIDVDAGGRRYQEMHVDGGAMAQVFVYPTGLDFEALAVENDSERQRTLYVIRNSRLDPDGAQGERRTLSIAGRAISWRMHTQALGALYPFSRGRRGIESTHTSRTPRATSTRPTRRSSTPSTCGRCSPWDTTWPPEAIPGRRRRPTTRATANRLRRRIARRCEVGRSSSIPAGSSSDFVSDGPDHAGRGTPTKVPYRGARRHCQDRAVMQEATKPGVVAVANGSAAGHRRAREPARKTLKGPTVDLGP